MSTTINNRSAWYQEEARAHDRALAAPMGRERERNERAAAEIARGLYAKKYGVAVPRKSRALCRWATNAQGAAVIRDVTFIGHGALSNALELPGWQGRPVAVERAEPSLF